MHTVQFLRKFKVFLVIAEGQPSCAIWNGRNHLAPHPDFKGSFLAGDMSLLYGITCNEILVQHNQVSVPTSLKFSSVKNITAIVEVGDPTKTQQLGELTYVSKSWMPALSSLAKGLGHTAGTLLMLVERRTAVS